MKGLYPTENIGFELPVFSQLPPDKRPKFFTRFLTANQEIAIEQFKAQAAENEGVVAPNGVVIKPADFQKVWQSLSEILRRMIVGWENVRTFNGQTLAFDSDKIDELKECLSYHDCWQLVIEAKNAIRLRREDLGKSESPSKSSTATSAPTATPTLAPGNPAN